MKAAKYLALCAVLLFNAHHGLAADVPASETGAMELTEKKILSAAMPLAEEEKRVQINESLAWQQFCLAKNSGAADEQSEAYAKAIKYISDATAIASAPPSTFLLGSRIYRHKGGISFAKNYFTRAAAVYLDEAMQKPESIQANLNAAIILYAGDVRYWESAEQSKKNAWNYADKVLTLCQKVKAEKKLESAEEIFFEEAAALAFMVKENLNESNAHFAKAEKLWNSETTKKNSVLIRINKSANLDALEKTVVYKPYELFKQFPQQGKWYWDVTNQADAGKEFLLNCLTGFYFE